MGTVKKVYGISDQVEMMFVRLMRFKLYCLGKIFSPKASFPLIEWVHHTHNPDVVSCLVNFISGQLLLRWKLNIYILLFAIYSLVFKSYMSWNFFSHFLVIFLLLWCLNHTLGWSYSFVVLYIWLKYNHV